MNCREWRAASPVNQKSELRNNCGVGARIAQRDSLAVSTSAVWHWLSILFVNQLSPPQEVQETLVQVTRSSQETHVLSLSCQEPAGGPSWGVQWRSVTWTVSSPPAALISRTRPRTRLTLTGLIRHNTSGSSPDRSGLLFMRMREYVRAGQVRLIKTY